MFKKKYILSLFSLNLILGILAIIIGLFTIFNPLKIVKIITLGLGLYLSVRAIFKAIEALKLKKYGFDGWLLIIVISILLLILGIVMIINPMAAMDIVEVSGLFIIFSSILELCNLVMVYSKAKEIKKLINKNI